MTCDRLVVFSGYSVAICDKVCQWLVTGWWFSLGTPWQYVIKFVHIATEYPKKTTNLLQVINKLYHILPQSTQRKPPTCHKSLTNFITYWHRVPRENHQPVTSHWQTLSHIDTEYPEKTTNLSQVINKLYHILTQSTQRKPPTCYKSVII
jgi:hypothetical protein